MNVSIIHSLKEVMQTLLHRENGEIDESGLHRLQQMHQSADQKHQGEQIHQPSISDAMEHLQSQPHNNRLIAYVRTLDAEQGRVEQRRQIDEYCETHGLQVIECFDWDTTKPSTALHDALDMLQVADGLIINDLMRLEEHPGDPLRDLTPLIYEHFLHEGKRLIAINQEIDTSTTAGKQRIVKFINKLSDVDYGTC